MITYVLVMLALAAPADAEAYRAAFDRVHDACEREQARIWQLPLCGPMLIADRDSGRLYADRADPDGLLRPTDHGLFSVPIPESMGLANTAVDLGGERWALVLAPLPDDPVEQARLFLHESFHRIQPKLGIPMTGAGSAGHVDGHPGRLWLRLEWRALATALVANDDASFRSALRDALLFRLHRYALIPGAREAETALELNEGLAEYSGVRAAYDDPRGLIAERLRAAERRDTLVRSFAYESGPAWGLVLDRLCAGWPGSVRAGANFTELVQCFAGPAGDASAEARAEAYGLSKVTAEEQAREAARLERMAGLAARFVDGPTLVLPLEMMQMQFDPSRVTAFPGHGTVYEGLTLSDGWGRIEVQSEALISDDFTRLVVPGRPRLVNDSGVAGEGWVLELASGWVVETGRPHSRIARTDGR